MPRPRAFTSHNILAATLGFGAAARRTAANPKPTTGSWRKPTRARLHPGTETGRGRCRVLG
ncbi:hypothetical protein [Streptomyces sp. NPDC052811]|uniref:hypothetical protein n=1 Tax=Streptomyces sp. NPDC052811 TaxID=3155731 RepID=UPI003442179B